MNYLLRNLEDKSWTYYFFLYFYKVVRCCIKFYWITCVLIYRIYFKSTILLNIKCVQKNILHDPYNPYKNKLTYYYSNWRQLFNSESQKKLSCKSAITFIDPSYLNCINITTLLCYFWVRFICMFCFARYFHLVYSIKELLYVTQIHS